MAGEADDSARFGKVETEIFSGVRVRWERDDLREKRSRRPACCGPAASLN